MKPDIPKPQPTPTPPTDTAAQDEATAREMAAIRKRKGQAATRLTNRRGQAGTLLKSPAGAPLGNTAPLGNPNPSPLRMMDQPAPARLS